MTFLFALLLVIGGMGIGYAIWGGDPLAERGKFVIGEEGEQSYWLHDGARYYARRSNG